MQNVIGIDLGTTYSVVAHVNGRGKPQVIRNEFGHTLTPSLVAFKDGALVVGELAKEIQNTNDAQVARFFKLHMGDPNFQLSLGDRLYTPIELSAQVLSYLRGQAERHLQARVSAAVITVPAYFDHMQRTSTIEAGEKAGLHVLKIINEPTAAALAYGLRPQQKSGTILVYDLGGGTFDISLVSIDEHELRVVATDGDHNLGGKDWDDRLIEYIIDQFQDTFSIELTDDEIERLRPVIEQRKQALSVRQSVDIEMRVQGHSKNYTLSRTQFETLTRDLVERTALLTAHILRDQNISWQDIDGILPVGGSTRMPMIQRYIEQAAGKAALSGANPDEIVALGAAIEATREIEQRTGDSTIFALPGYHKTTIDVTSHSLGMIAENNARSHYINSIIIAKNSTVPCQQTRPYAIKLRRDGKTQLEIFLTQGEDDDPQHCTYPGRFVFSAFPASNDASATIDVTYKYNKNGTIDIQAVERKSGQPLKLSPNTAVPIDVPARFARRPDQNVAQELPVVYFAFDLSGSMRDEPLVQAKQAAHNFVRNYQQHTVSIGMISFSDWAHVDLVATKDTRAIRRAIEQLAVGATGRGNNANPFEALQKSFASVNGRKCAVILTDGIWAYSDRAIEQARICREQGIELSAIGFGNADQNFLEQIAPGQSIYTDLAHLVEAFSTIAQEIIESTDIFPVE